MNNGSSWGPGRGTPGLSFSANGYSRRVCARGVIAAKCDVWLVGGLPGWLAGELKAVVVGVGVVVPRRWLMRGGRAGRVPRVMASIVCCRRRRCARRPSWPCTTRRWLMRGGLAGRVPRVMVSIVCCRRRRCAWRPSWPCTTRRWLMRGGQAGRVPRVVGWVRARQGETWPSLGAPRPVPRAAGWTGHDLSTRRHAGPCTAHRWAWEGKRGRVRGARRKDETVS